MCYSVIASINDRFVFHMLAARRKRRMWMILNVIHEVAVALVSMNFTGFPQFTRKADESNADRVPAASCAQDSQRKGKYRRAGARYA